MWESIITILAWVTTSHSTHFYDNSTGSYLTDGII